MLRRPEEIENRRRMGRSQFDFDCRDKLHGARFDGRRRVPLPYCGRHRRRIVATQTSVAHCQSRGTSHIKLYQAKTFCPGTERRDRTSRYL